MKALKEKKQDKYLPVNQVAKILGCTERFVYLMVKDGKLKALRLGSRAIRISECSLNEFVNSNTVDPDDFFGFEVSPRKDHNPTAPSKIVRSAWMDK